MTNMQITNLDMINNAVKTAKFKLSQHKVQGEQSSLTVFQVARLMDTIKRGEEAENTQNNSIYFSLN